MRFMVQFDDKVMINLTYILPACNFVLVPPAVLVEHTGSGV